MSRAEAVAMAEICGTVHVRTQDGHDVEIQGFRGSYPYTCNRGECGLATWDWGRAEQTAEDAIRVAEEHLGGHE